jgi:hypothetical protein
VATQWVTQSDICFSHSQYQEQADKQGQATYPVPQPSQTHRQTALSSAQVPSGGAAAGRSQRESALKDMWLSPILYHKEVPPLPACPRPSSQLGNRTYLL